MMSDNPLDSESASGQPDLEALWLPFTHNRHFKQHPRMVSGAEGMYYTTPDGRRVLDGLSGLWCCNAGHRHPRIVAAVKAQLDELDYAVAFQVQHPKAFELANALTAAAPGDLNHVFFTNSGSEAVDTALKMALAYHKARGDGGSLPSDWSRQGLSRRWLRWHLGRRHECQSSRFRQCPAAGRRSSAPYPQPRAEWPSVKGQPAWGAHLADELENIVALHDASTIAAVIVEPMQGSAGVIVPPQGYLERLRAICDKHGILLIFDEVITGFGRIGELFSPTRSG